jgi:hypothetical protein
MATGQQPMEVVEEENKKTNHMKKPTPFHGDRRKVQSFLVDCRLYILANKKTFKNDAEQVLFILSYMDGGEAEKWKHHYLDSIENATTHEFDFGTIDKFTEAFKEAFQYEDEKEDAIRRLETIRQGNRSAEEMTNEFRLLIGKAGLDEKNEMLIRNYRRALRPQLANKILYSTDKPKDLAGWYKIAAQYDRIHREAVETLKDSNPRSFGNNLRKSYGSYQPRYNNGGNRYQSQSRDPNAMDVDAMSIDKRNDLMKKGLCFGCEKPGHLSRDCPEKQPNYRNDDRPYTPKNDKNPFRKANNELKKLGYKDIHAHIRALSIEDKERLFDLADEDDGEKGDIEKDF